MLKEAGECAAVIHRDVATRKDFEYYLQTWLCRGYSAYTVGYLAFHGERRTLALPNDEDITLYALVEVVDGRGEGKVPYLGSCSVLAGRGPTFEEDLRQFCKATGFRALVESAKDVEWIESAAFDVLLPPQLLNGRHTNTLDDRLEARYGRLVHTLGPRIATRTKLQIWRPPPWAEVGGEPDASPYEGEIQKLPEGRQARASAARRPGRTTTRPPDASVVSTASARPYSASPRCHGGLHCVQPAHLREHPHLGRGERIHGRHRTVLRDRAERQHGAVREIVHKFVDRDHSTREAMVVGPAAPQHTEVVGYEGEVCVPRDVTQVRSPLLDIRQSRAEDVTGAVDRQGVEDSWAGPAEDARICGL